MQGRGIERAASPKVSSVSASASALVIFAGVGVGAAVGAGEATAVGAGEVGTGGVVGDSSSVKQISRLNSRSPKVYSPMLRRRRRREHSS